MLSAKHPLVKLADVIDWEEIERSFGAHFQTTTGRPALSPRLVAGLLYLQHAYDCEVDRVMEDTTVMPKAIAHPTDSRLLEKSRQHLVKLATDNNIALRQNYNREAPRLAAQVGRYAHAKQYRRMKRSLRTLKTRVGRVHREIERKIAQVPENARPQADSLLQRVQRILTQKTKDKNKLYEVDQFSETGSWER